MNEETLALIEKLAASLGTTSEHIIEQYTSYHYIEAISFISFGAALIIGGIKAPTNEEWDANPFIWAAKVIAVAVGSFMVVVNVPQLFEPQAMAIHQLIIDITR